MSNEHLSGSECWLTRFDAQVDLLTDLIERIDTAATSKNMPEITSKKLFRAMGFVQDALNTTRLARPRYEQRAVIARLSRGAK